MSTDPTPTSRAAECIGCPPCPGRGNDGHGLTHCAECCFGTGVEADLACPVHGDPAMGGGTAAAGDKGLRAHPHVAAVRDYLDNAGITPEALRYAATHEALCRSWIFDLLTGLADTLDATPAPTEDPAPSQDTLRAAVRVVAYLDELDAFYSTDEHPDDILDYATGDHTSAALHLSDIRALAALAATTPEATGRDGVEG